MMPGPESAGLTNRPGRASRVSLRGRAAPADIPGPGNRPAAARRAGGPRIRLQARGRFP